MARWWRFFLFLAPVASVDMPCALTPQTVARIREWVHSGAVSYTHLTLPTIHSV